MKVLVTGGAGFIGSNIVDAYVQAGHEVVVVDNLATGKKSNVNRAAKFYRADITDGKRIAEIIRNERPEVVNHHAAQIDVRKSVADPRYDADINIMGALNLLENSRENGVRKVIFASSGGTIYGECGRIAPDETARACPVSPYGITKHAIELYLAYYAGIHGMRFTALRYGNVYGPRQDPHGEAGVVAIFSRRMLKGEDVLIFGGGTQTRDYVFVGDVVRANVAALKKADNQVVNIGTGRLTSVKKLFAELARLTGYGKAPVVMPARAGELRRSFLNYDKAVRLLKWEPQTDLRLGLAQTLDFFRSAQ